MSLITQATEAVKRLQEKLSLRRDYIDTFSTSHGQRVLADIMSRAGVTTPRFNADPELARFLEGHRHLPGKPEPERVPFFLGLGLTVVLTMIIATVMIMRRVKMG